MGGYILADKSQIPSGVQYVVYYALRVVPVADAEAFKHLKCLPGVAVGSGGDTLDIPVARVAGKDMAEVRQAIGYWLETSAKLVPPPAKPIDAKKAEPGKPTATIVLAALAEAATPTATTGDVRRQLEVYGYDVSHAWVKLRLLHLVKLGLVHQRKVFKTSHWSPAQA
jgi:hypothetical protein